PNRPTVFHEHASGIGNIGPSLRGFPGVASLLPPLSLPCPMPSHALFGRSVSRLLRSLLAVLSLGAAGCLAEPEPEPPPDSARLEADWRGLVAARDSFFRSPASPLLPTDRDAFDGLAYFPYDTAFVYRAQVRPELARDTFGMVTSTGEVRPFIRYGL